MEFSERMGVTIRNLPDGVVAEVETAAALHRRSLESGKARRRHAERRGVPIREFAGREGVVDGIISR